MRSKKASLQRMIYWLFIIVSFLMPDFWLRIVTRWIGKYSIYSPIPTIFTLLWVLILWEILYIIPSRKLRRIVYGILYFATAIFAIIQYGAYQILGDFLFLSDFRFAGEGAEYAEYIVDIITPSFFIQILFFLVVGIIGIIFIPAHKKLNKKFQIILFISVFFELGMILTLPFFYSDESEIGFNSPATEYSNFSNADYDMELCGLYQYFARDCFLNISKNFKDYSSTYAEIDAFFSEQKNESQNELTGIFEGKNVIIFMMESMDDWLITQENTPTIYRLMNEGICFKDFYTPGYANGYTFNTEFAFNTSIYPYSNGNTTYALSRNLFSESIANKFADAGYKVESFHSGTANFYNRGMMHQAFGYSSYNSYRDYSDSEVEVHDDSFLVTCEQLYEELTSGEPFMSFVITYSPHLPYSTDDELTQYALEKHPEYQKSNLTEEDILRAKARLTDDMFDVLIEKLEEDGLLEDTVIIGFADHYAFGMQDKELLEELSIESGNPILENTPAFIYNVGIDPLQVNKTMQTTDLGPTIENLFGVEVAKNVMGHDIFDEEYSGYAIMPNFTWISNGTYVKDGSVIEMEDMSEEEISEMNYYIEKVYHINDSILDSDYYREKQ